MFVEANMRAQPKDLTGTIGGTGEIPRFGSG